MAASSRFQRIAIIGFGEAGSILGQDLASAGFEIVTYDILLDEASHRDAMLAKAERANATIAASTPEAAAKCDLMISAVTASSSSEVARLAGSALQSGQLFLDINSVSPDTKRENAKSIAQSGADYVDVAHMAPLPPLRLGVPMLLGGSAASWLASELNDIGMNAKCVSDQVGVASAIKMCRSVIIKGLEALAVECLLTARRYDAEETVLASLEASFPGMGWNDKLPSHLISRVAEHGQRRAAEMREVARTVRDAGLEPIMAAAIADIQEWLVETMIQKGISYNCDSPFTWQELADLLEEPTQESASPGRSS
jgi:3-hydroxyisobutyrate dehydrogenase-like beta-hydroxyacid dehydrogenase